MEVSFSAFCQYEHSLVDLVTGSKSASMSTNLRFPSLFSSTLSCLTLSERFQTASGSNSLSYGCHLKLNNMQERARVFEREPEFSKGQLLVHQTPIASASIIWL